MLEIKTLKSLHFNFSKPLSHTFMSWFGILQNEEENLESSQYRWRILVSSGAIPKSELKDSKLGFGTI